jgi:hypothetical protein
MPCAPKWEKQEQKKKKITFSTSPQTLLCYLFSNSNFINILRSNALYNKVKLSLYRPWRSLRLGLPHFQTFGSQMATRLSALRSGRFLPPRRFLVLIFVRGWVDPRAIVRLEGWTKLKKSTSSETRIGDLPACYIITHEYDTMSLNKLFFPQWLFKSIQGPGLLFGSVIIFTQPVGLFWRVISPSQGLYLNTGLHRHRIKAYTRQTSMPWLGFEPTILASGKR